MLHNLGCLRFSPLLDGHIRQGKLIPSKSNWEIELRGSSIWCVEMIRQEIMKQHPEVRGGSAVGSKVETPAEATSDNPRVEDGPNSKEDLDSKPEAEVNGTIEGKNDVDESDDKPMAVNAILIDFFLYDTMKELENEGKVDIPHHRTRSIWY